MGIFSEEGGIPTPVQKRLQNPVPWGKNSCAKMFWSPTTIEEQICMQTFQKPFPCKFGILDSVMHAYLRFNWKKMTEFLHIQWDLQSDTDNNIN